MDWDFANGLSLLREYILERKPVLVTGIVLSVLFVVAVDDRMRRTRMLPRVGHLLRGVWSALVNRRASRSRGVDAAVMVDPAARNTHVNHHAHIPLRESAPVDRHSAADSARHRPYHLLFDGEGWQEGALRRGRSARLLFSDIAGAAGSQVATLLGERLDDTARQNARLVILVTPPPGLIFRSDGGTARFVDGRLAGDVIFDFDVAVDCPDRVDIGIEFYGASRLYGVTLPVAVSDVGKAAIPIPDAVPGRTIQLDAGDATSQETVLLKLGLGVDGLQLLLLHAKAGAAVQYTCEARLPKLDAAAIQTLLNSVGSELGADFFDGASWRDAAPAEADLAQCRERVASAGSILHRALTQSPEAKTLFAYLDGLPEGTRIVVATPGLVLPLELAYPPGYSKNWPTAQKQLAPPVLEKFWGMRFALEIVHSGEGDYRGLQATHHRAKRAVILNLDKGIAGADLGPLDIHRNLKTRLDGLGISCSVADDCDAMREVLLGGRGAASVIYVYCHGAGAAPGTGESESLRLDADCAVTPFDAVPESRHSAAPVVVLNACQTGNTSPLLFTGFLDMFRKQGALGVIATSFYIPIVFGAEFGARLVEACITHKVPLGERVRRLRRDYARGGNPVPLFYSVQCQLDPEETP
jgi:hypothetical protein